MGPVMTMRDNVIIFGTGDLARLARIYFVEDGGMDVVAFAADGQYVTEPKFEGLPLLPIEDARKRFPPGSVKMFVAVGYKGVNRTRAAVYQRLKAAGYGFVSYVHSTVRTWSSNNIGENSFIFEDNTIQPNVTIGNNVILWSGGVLCHDSVIEDHCFLSAHVCIAGYAKIGPYCFLGINATIRDGVTVAERNVIGAGAIILADTEPDGVYVTPMSEKRRLPSHKLRGL